MATPVVLVVGAGSGIGAATARRFGGEGYAAALVARSPDRLEALARSLGEAGVSADWVAADVTDDRLLAGAVTRLGERAGRIDVLHYNPSAFRHKDPLELAPDELLADLRLGVAGLLTAVQAARPFMTAGARVTATGSMAADRPWNEAASLGVQKAGLRNLVRSLDTTLQPDGIRAMSLTVNGTLAPNGPFSPDRVADALYQAVTAGEDDWRVEVPYDG